MRERVRTYSMPGTYPTDWQGFGQGCGPYGFLFSRQTDWSILQADKANDLSHLLSNQGAHAWYLSETIKDSLGKTRVHECDHVKWSAAAPSALGLGSIIANGTVSISGQLYNWEVYRRFDGNGLLRWCWDVFPDTMDVIDYPIDQSWLSRTMDQSALVVSPDLDLAAEIVQLGDLRGAVSSIASAVRRLYKILPGSDRRWKREWRTRKGVLKTLKTMIGAHLATKWAVLPVLSDIDAVSKIVRTAHTRLEVMQRVLRQSYRSYRSGYPVPTSAAETQIAVTRSSVHTPSDLCIVYTVKRTRRTAGSYGLGCIQRFSGDLASLDLASYITSRTGLDRPLSTIWELVPYSFVLDYFLNVDAAIQRFESMSADIKMHRTDGYKTSKFSTSCDFTLDVSIRKKGSTYPYPVVLAWDDSWNNCAQIEHSHFHRVPMEFTSHFLEETWKKRVFTLSELAIQRVKSSGSGYNPSHGRGT